MKKFKISDLETLFNNLLRYANIEEFARRVIAELEVFSGVHDLDPDSKYREYISPSQIAKLNLTVEDMTRMLTIISSDVKLCPQIMFELCQQAIETIS